MVLRPATPLSIVLFIAFAFLLLSVLSTPIIEGINIATFGGVKFGVLGWCSKTTGCSKISIGYNMGMWLAVARVVQCTKPFVHVRRVPSNRNLQADGLL